MPLGLSNNLLVSGGTPVDYALDLNGTDEYLSKSSPSKLDLNGASMVDEPAKDSTFEDATTNWTQLGGSNHTVIGTSTDDKRSGSKSLKITATGAGDASANYVGLPNGGFNTTAIVEGNKYTIRGFFRSDTAGTTATFQIGNKLYTSGTISTTAGTFTRVALNFEATSVEADPARAIKVFFNKACTVYLDDFDIAQAYDLAIIIKSYATAFSNNAQVQYRASSGVVSGWDVGFINISGVPLFRLSDGTGELILTGDTMSTPEWIVRTGVINRTGNATLYKNGTSVATIAMTTYGIVKSTASLEIGARGASSLFKGKIAKVQAIRFNNIGSSDFNPATHVIGATPSGGGTEVVALYDWEGDSTTFDDDKSGTGNNLTGTNITLADRVRI